MLCVIVIIARKIGWINRTMHTFNVSDIKYNNFIQDLFY